MHDDIIFGLKELSMYQRIPSQCSKHIYIYIYILLKFCYQAYVMRLSMCVCCACWYVQECVYVCVWCEYPPLRLVGILVASNISSVCVL